MSVSATLLAVMMLADSTATVPKPPANEEDKLICRRELATGSLVRSTRRCQTRKEWARQAEAVRRDAEEMRARSGPVATN